MGARLNLLNAAYGEKALLLSQLAARTRWLIRKNGFAGDAS